MKKLSCVLVALAMFTLVSCDSTKTDRDTADGNLGSDTASRSSTTNTSTNTNTNSSSPVTDQAVTEFVQKALSGGMMEVELGNLAAANARNPRVKNFGSMMVADHSAAGNELKQMASSNSLTAPSTMLPEHQKHVDMMKGKTGAAFDKAYMGMMVTDHKEDISQYQKAAGDLSVQSYKDFASKTLPVLKKHLDSAQAIQKSL